MMRAPHIVDIDARPLRHFVPQSEAASGTEDRRGTESCW